MNVGYDTAAHGDPSYVFKVRFLSHLIAFLTNLGPTSKLDFHPSLYLNFVNTAYLSQLHALLTSLVRMNTMVHILQICICNHSPPLRPKARHKRSHNFFR